MNHFRTLRANRVSWYHSDKPLTKEEREMLAKKFGFYQHHLESTRQGKTPRPKISINKKYTYFVFHIPYLPKNSNKISICDLNVFVTKTALVTIESQGDIPALNKYYDGAEKSKRVCERRLKHGAANLFANLMKYILNDLEELIDHQGEKVDTLNKKIFKVQESNKIIETISVLRYNQTISFTALEKQARVVEQYMGDKNPLKSFPKASNDKWNVIVEGFQTYVYELRADIGHLEALVKPLKL